MERRGIVLIEVLTACGLLAVLLALCIQLLSLTAIERRHVERRAIAMQAAANLVEQASVVPFDQLTDEKLAAIEVSPGIARLLPDVKTMFTVVEEPHELTAKRVRVEIQWKGRGGRREPPVRLTYFAYDSAKPARQAEAKSPKKGSLVEEEKTTPEDASKGTSP